MKLRAGNIDVVIGYEQRGDSWVLYRRDADVAPGASQQHVYTEVVECHEAWQQECHAAIDGSDGLFAPAADVATRHKIAAVLGDA